MYILFGIPNCDTVKKARTYLESRSIPFEFIDFKKSPPTLELIKMWKDAFAAMPVNKKGVTYKKHAAHFEALSSNEQMTFLILNSSMIKRPILQKDKKVLCFGFDEKSYQEKVGK